MKAKIGVFIAIFLIGIAIVSAHGEEDFAKAEELIKSKIQCNQLTDDQLEVIGEYYMEQMHPGELHEQMDEMMGGEGSASLKQIHVSMGKAFYCGEHDAMSTGMMSMMMNRGMIGSSGMMEGMFNQQGANYNNPIVLLVLILIILVVIAIIIWLLKTNKRK
ncbi:hypothetical protein HYV49_02030 [Candidatus Pacearchaeota archaeon]|nr:hypothetical protein [Candidatus Pacearchaeota archaeon]